MTDRNTLPSAEVLHGAVTEFILAADWDTRFTANSASMRALRAELDEATDTDEVLRLTELKGEALVRTLGSGALSLFKRDIIAERDAFAAEFGEL